MTNETKPLLSNSRDLYQNDPKTAVPLAPEYAHPDPNSPNSSSSSSSSKASFQQTVLNIAKTCVGTGTLALPFAVTQGGFLFSIIGLALVAKWNLYSVKCLMRCDTLLSELLQSRNNNSHESSFVTLEDDSITAAADEKKKQTNKHQQHQGGCPEGTSTFGQISYYSFGSIGLHISDFVMLILYVGIALSFIDLVKKLTNNAGFTTGSNKLDLCLLALTIIGLSSVPDLGFLHSFSALGLSAVILAFLVIFMYGLTEFGIEGFSHKILYHLWPKGLHGFSKWFGVCVFGFGVTPIAYNIQESMQHPHQMTQATDVALVSVMCLYVIIGAGVAILYAPENDYDFVGQVLNHLPNTWISTVVLLAMSLTTLMSTPLIMIPCGDLILGKLGYGKNPSRIRSLLVRWSVTVAVTIISALVPDFISVVSFIGNSCLSLVSFTFPPLIHIILSMKVHHRRRCPSLPSPLSPSSQHPPPKNPRMDMEAADGTISKAPETSTSSGAIRNNEMYMDVLMLCIGVFVTVFSTYTSLHHGI